MEARCSAVWALALTLVPVCLHAQTIPRDAYYDHLPPYPRIISQTAASARLHLYGDARSSGYSDAAPRDGIDDQLGTRLLDIAERFSPILRRNNFSVPRAFLPLLGTNAFLHVDTWSAGKLVAVDSVDLRPRFAFSPSVADPLGAPATPNADERLLQLLLEFHPDLPRRSYVHPETYEEKVLFFDFPGKDEISWRRAYESLNVSASGIYAHFFVYEDPASATAERYQLIVQYWLFYPFNDAANNHEGDWEQINVSVATRERAAAGPGPAGRLRESDIRRILDPNVPLLDSLVIRHVEYYFHENVMNLDYWQVLYSPGAERRQRTAVHFWEDGDFIADVVRRRARLAGGRLGTHPIGYIGANSKGPDELLKLVPRFGGAYNRNSHGTYPFPGTWQRVGPAAATEKIRGDVVPRVRENAPEHALWHALLEDDHYVAFPRERIVLVPDWERVAQLVLTDAQVRRDWSWLLLPIRWGFPAARSPAAGLIKHTDLGNVAPEGPAYQPRWNRLGSETGVEVYEPRVLRVIVVPTNPWSDLDSGRGFINLVLAGWGLLPGGHVVTTQVMPWVSGVLHLLGAPPAKTFLPGALPLRFTTTGSGAALRFGGDDFVQLLPQAEHPDVSAILLARPQAQMRNSYRERDISPRLWLNLFYGRRFSVENTFSWGSTLVQYELADSRGLAGTVRGQLDLKELSGGFRYSPLIRGEKVELFLRLGYGWSWYNVGRVQLDGQPLDGAGAAGGYPLALWPLRRLWPNTWYVGVGAEFFSPKQHWLADRVGYGARLEWTGLMHRLGGARTEGRSNPTVTRADVALGGFVAW